MDQQTILLDIETRAKCMGLSIAAICRKASVHPTTFSRWKRSEKNPEPVGATFKSLHPIIAVLERAESDPAFAETIRNEGGADGDAPADAEAEAA